MIDGGAIIAAVTIVISLSSGAVVLYVRATTAELRTEIGRTRADIIEHINNTYVRKKECVLLESATHTLIESLRHEVGGILGGDKRSHGEIS